MKLNNNNVSFFKAQINYLRNLISREGISHLPETFDETKSILPPGNNKELRQFLGLTDYYKNRIIATHLLK